MLSNLNDLTVTLWLWAPCAYRVGSTDKINLGGVGVGCGVEYISKLIKLLF